ncbi:MAG: CDC48 family AAA ATPase [Candidatus Hermodarchaeota archaeon]
MVETNFIAKEAYFQDVGRGITRISAAEMEKLSLKPGDIVEIEGTKKTTAIIWPLKSSEDIKGIIRMDGALRLSAGVELDEPLKISKATILKAQKIVFDSKDRHVIIGIRDFLRSQLKYRPVSVGDKIRIKANDQTADYSVLETDPDSDSVLITPRTKLVIKGLADKTLSLEKKGISRVYYEDLGGIGLAIQRVREIIELPIRFPELFQHFGCEPPRGVLLYGPPGTGKTLLAKAVATESDAYFISISGPVVISKFYGESEQKIREIFEEAEKNAPSIIFIDEIDSIAPKREEVSGEVEQRVVAQLLALMDGLETRGQVIVIGATNRPNALDPALRRPGRFDREIEINIPNQEGRLEILQVHTKNMPLDNDVDLEELAKLTQGFVGADLSALVREAAIKQIHKILPGFIHKTEAANEFTFTNLKVTMSDFVEALKDIEPSTVREVVFEKSRVSWKDIGGLEDIKRRLIEEIVWLIRHPKLPEKVGLELPKGLLLHGPSGTGKTHLIKALAHESQMNFINIKASEVYSKWVGESEKAIREIFRKAKLAEPCLVFFDEINTLAPTRGSQSSEISGKVISALLTELDSLEPSRKVVVAAATNRLEDVDPALLRAGRFDLLLKVDYPDEDARKKIFLLKLKNKTVDESVNLSSLVKQTKDFSGADIAAICREALLVSLRRRLGSYDLEKLETEINFYDSILSNLEKTDVKTTMDDFKVAIDQIKKIKTETPVESKSLISR